MPTDQKQDSAPSRETWIDWVPAEGREEALLDAEPLLTRDELVAQLRDLGEDVTARDLIHWQTRGVIPYPDRRRHKGATRGVYPQWMTRTIRMLRSLQEQGYTLREIGPLLRGDLYHFFMPRALTPHQEQQQARRVAKRALFPLIDELDPRIRAFARIHERLHGGRITHAEVRLIDDQGKDHAYLFFAGDTEEEDPATPMDGVKHMV